jgi:hypothetical protein
MHIKYKIIRWKEFSQTFGLNIYAANPTVSLASKL